MKISIITASFNRQNTILETLRSVKTQSYKDIEHIIIDGGSADNTADICRSFGGLKVLSEQDEGIYDAINKGIKLSTGDVVGLLHSDDIYASDFILEQVASVLSDPMLDAVYADANFFRHGNPNKIIRVYRSDRFSVATLPWGWMPAHTTIFFRRSVFEKFGFYKTDYKIAADMEFIARVFRSENFRAKYIPNVWVKMGIGGVSTGGWKNTFLLNKEVLRALRENGIKTNLLKILTKYPLKLFEFL